MIFNRKGEIEVVKKYISATEKHRRKDMMTVKFYYDRLLECLSQNAGEINNDLAGYFSGLPEVEENIISLLKNNEEQERSGGS